MPRYVNIGCGFSVGPSWENYDASPTLRFERLPILGRLYTKNTQRFPDVAMYGDIMKGPIGRENSADAVFCSHILEHLALEDMRRSLRHIFTMLKPNGVFRLIVPDLGCRALAYTKQLGQEDSAVIFMEETGLGSKSSRITFGSRIKAVLANSKHLWMYDNAAMRRELEDAGFVAIRNCRFGDSKIKQFGEIEDLKRFESRYGPELAFECKKPNTNQ